MTPLLAAVGLQETSPFVSVEPRHTNEDGVYAHVEHHRTEFIEHQNWLSGDFQYWYVIEWMYSDICENDEIMAPVADKIHVSLANQSKAYTLEYYTPRSLHKHVPEYVEGLPIDKISPMDSDDPFESDAELVGCFMMYCRDRGYLV